MFFLIVDNFGIEYVVKEHVDHIASVLWNYHEITVDWEGKKCPGIDIEWYYIKRICHLRLKNYFKELCAK